ncbi:hypothetical protein Q427_21630 [Halomonas sp. BC04]|nr:hypothetical protein Q427_21630 [Halomonas sp. BC04]
MEIASRMMLRVVDQHQVGEVVIQGGQAGRVQVAPDVAVDQQEGRVAQQRQCAVNAAAGLERALLPAPGDGDVESRAITQGLDDLLGTVADVDHHLVDAGRCQALQVMDDERLAGHR